MLVRQVSRSLVCRSLLCIENNSRAVLASARASYCSPASDHGDEHAKTFSDFSISPRRISSLQKAGIEKMFPVQEHTFPHIFEGRDVIARAKTGTGKTLAFILPLIERFVDVDPSPRRPAIVILAPTRELAVQVSREIEKIDPRLNAVTVYGGASISNQARALSRPVDIVVGTPGRMIHFIEEGTLDLSKVKAFVLDEADQMLDFGFKLDIERIMKEMPREKQTLLFSATIPPWVKNVSSSYMHNPETIDLIGDRKTPDKVTHNHIQVSKESQRLVALALLLKERESEDRKTLIFVDTKLECAEIANNTLVSQYSTIRALHGDVSQNERAMTLDHFRAGKVRTLIATDVASRGLDIPGVDLVVNYRPPRSTESYIHRSGRGGRAGKLGTSVIIYCGSEEQSTLNFIEKKTGTPFSNYTLASAEEQTGQAKDSLRDTLRSLAGSMGSQPSTLAKELSEELGAEKALSAALSLLLNESESANSFSMLNGTPGIATGMMTSKLGRVFKSKIADLLRSMKISANIEETKDGEFVFDISSHDATKLRTLCENEDAEFSFEILSSPPVLRFDAPAPRPDGGSKRGGRGSRDGFRGDRGDRGYRSEGSDRFRGRDRDRNRGGRDRSPRGGSYADRPRNDRNRGGRDRSPGRGYDRDRQQGSFKKESRNDLNFDFLFD